MDCLILWDFVLRFCQTNSIKTVVCVYIYIYDLECIMFYCLVKNLACVITYYMLLF